MKLIIKPKVELQCPFMILNCYNGLIEMGDKPTGSLVEQVDKTVKILESLEETSDSMNKAFIKCFNQILKK